MTSRWATQYANPRPASATRSPRRPCRGSLIFPPATPPASAAPPIRLRLLAQLVDALGGRATRGQVFLDFARGFGVTARAGQRPGEVFTPLDSFGVQRHRLRHELHRPAGIALLGLDQPEPVVPVS